MVVSFVNAGLMELVQAIGVILGANIGTTFTGWLVALLGFSMDITILALTAIAIAAPLMFSKRSATSPMSSWDSVSSLGLNLMSASMPDISESAQVMQYLSLFNSDTFAMRLIGVLLGMLITLVVQSSSATMAMVLTMAFNGWLGLYTATALILGSKIGTTITAFLASIGTSTEAKRAAWAHIIFNVTGVTLAPDPLPPDAQPGEPAHPRRYLCLRGAELAARLLLPAMLATLFSTVNICSSSPS